MAGNFARGFMQTFGPTLQNTQSRKDDMFKNFYRQFSDKQEKRQEYAAKERQAVSQAKLIAQELGLPEGAWKEISKDFIMGSGMDYKEAKEAAKSFKWNPTDLPAGQTTPDNPSQMETQEQMRQSGLSPEQMAPQGTAPQTPQEAPTGGIPQPIVSGLNRLKEAFKGRDMDSVMRRMEQETGLPRAQIEMIMAQNPEAIEPLGDTSKIMAQAQEQRGYTKEPIAASENYTPDELKLVDDILKDYDKEYTGIRDRAVMAKGLVTDAADMVAIVERNPAVLANIPREGAQLISGFSTNAEQTLNLLFGKPSRAVAARKKIEEIETQTNNKASPELYQQAEEALEQEIAAIQKSPAFNRINRLAQDGTLFEMKKQLIAYKLASIYGQDSRNLSEVERQMFEEISAGGNTKEKFFQNFSVLLNRELGRVEDSRLEFMKKPRIVNFETMKPFPKVFEAGSIQDFVASTPENKDVLDKLAPYNTLGDLEEEQQQQNQTGLPEGYRTVGKTDKGLTIVEDAEGNQFVMGQE